MSDDDDNLPARVKERSGVPQDYARVPTAPFGLGAFAIARNWSERRQIESFTRLSVAKNALVEACLKQRRLLVDLGIANERLENIDAIRRAERLRIYNDVAQQQLQADIAGLEASVRIENLKAELAEARQRRQAIENRSESGASPKEKSPAEKIEDALADINSIDSVMKAQRAAFVSARGGEDKLSAEDRLIVEKLDVARATHVEKLMEDLFG